MKQFKTIIAGAILLLTACKTTKAIVAPTTPDKSVVLQTEMDFEKMAAQKGIAAAFFYYADSSAVINRGNDSLIYGKQGVFNYYNTPALKSATLTWHPDFIDVSSKGDLAYTYGKYQYQNTDANGKLVVLSGVFHTVWKKKADGTWRFVWD